MKNRSFWLLIIFISGLSIWGGCYTQLALPVQTSGNENTESRENRDYDDDARRYYRGYYFDGCRDCNPWDYYYSYPYWANSPWIWVDPVFEDDGNRPAVHKSLPAKRSGDDTTGRPRYRQGTEDTTDNPAEPENKDSGADKIDDKEKKTTDDKTLPTRR